MKSQRINLALVLLAVVVMAMANENPGKIQLDNVAGSKVKIIDNSRVLTPEEVEKLSNKDKIPIAEPVVKDPSLPVIEPKIGVVVNDKAAVDQKAAVNNNEPILPPIPVMLGSPFLNGLFDQPVSDDLSAADSNSGDDKPKSLTLVLRSQRVEDPSNPESGVKSSLIILRYLPKSIGSFFGMDQPDDSNNKNEQKLIGGGDDDPDKKRLVQVHLFGGDDDVDKKRPHLFGGDDDIDKKRIHLFGGDDDVDKKRMHLLGGEGDPDRIRLDLNENNNKGVFTGGNEDVFSNPEQHRIFVFSMFDRLRSMFDNMRQTFEQQVPSFSSRSDNDAEPSNLESMPFISIRTDDGQSALIPNDIGYAEKQQHEQSLNKCMMLQFMRLKASMYYRTILHLLFFTGVLLFIFSLVMLMVRACRRRQLARRHPHHRHHHANMSIASIEAGKTKLAAYKAWQGIDQSSLIDSDKVVLIQAPPAYDQVFIHDKNSTLTTSTARPSFTVEACQTTDECETKSLPPPEYEKSVKP